MTYNPSLLEKRVWDYVTTLCGTPVTYAYQGGDVPSMPFMMIQEGQENRIGHQVIKYEEHETDPNLIKMIIITELETTFDISAFDENDPKALIRRLGERQWTMTGKEALLDNEGKEPLVIRDYGPINVLFEDLGGNEHMKRAVAEFRIAYRHEERVDAPYIHQIEITGEDDLDGLVITKSI